MQQINTQKENNDTQTSMHMKALQETIDKQVLELEQMLKAKQNAEQKMQEMTQELEVNSKVRREAEERADRLHEDNQKLTTNYTVLKEHEMNIIQDFQDRKLVV